MGFGGVFKKRVTFLVGHFGSGKTEIALNASISIAGQGTPVSIVDLDVVKPYFRTRSAVDILAGTGVELVAPLGEYFSSDLPIIVPAVRASLADPGRKVLLDAGGDDTGVRVVGSLSGSIPVDETDFLIVLNFRRPFTQDVESAVQMAREIESASRFSVTGVISNTHLMHETTSRVIIEGYGLAGETAGRLGVPVVGVAAEDRLCESLDGTPFGCPVLPLKRIVKPPFEYGPGERKVGPLFKVG